MKLLKIKNKKIKVAIIGYGLAGQRRYKYISKNKNFKVISICDIRFKKNFFNNDIQFFKNYNDVLKQKIDAVFIELPNYLASLVTVAFLKRNINVFCEKPPGRNIKEVKKVIQNEKKHPLARLKYGFNHRYHPSVKMAKKIIDSKKYGKIINIRCMYGKSDIGLDSSSPWRAKRKLSGGGILLDQGIHMLDLLRFFCGDFLEYYSCISNNFWKYNVEDNAFALMRNKNGVIASIHSSATQWQHKFKIEISLERAILILDGILTRSKSYGKETLLILLRRQRSRGSSNKKISYSFNNDISWKSEIEEFAEILINGKSVTTCNSKDALKVMEMIEKIYSADKKWAKRISS